MRVPWIVALSVASQVLIPLAALRQRKPWAGPRLWIGLWGVVLVLWAGVQIPLAQRGINNLWVGYATAPFEVGALLVALAAWHSESRRRRLFYAAAGGFAVVETVLVLSFEHLDQFSLLVGPIKSLLLLSAAVWTLLACLRRHEGDLLREDWFWICLGVSLKYGSSAALDPLSSLLLPAHPEAVSVAFQAVAWIETFTSLIIARGLLCPVPPRLSSGPLSPAFSQSSSFSQHSGPRS